MKKLPILAAVALVAGFAFADKITLKSGSFLTGTAGEAKNGTLKFVSDDLGEVEIKLENIVKLENAGSHVVKYNDDSTETKTLAVADGKYVADGKPLDMSNVKEIDPAVETWHGSVNVGFLASRGNTYENSGSLVANINRRWEKDRLNGDFGYYYGESGQVGEKSRKTTDRWEAELKHDHFWLPKVYSYEDLRYDRDMMQDLLARYRVGLGLGYQWLEKSAFESTGVWSFNQELGANWIKEEFEGPNDAKEGGFAALRYAHHLAYVPKWAENIEVFHNAEYLPEVDDWEKFLAKCDLGFTTKLIYDFDLLAKIEWDYNSRPAGNRKRDDLRYIVGLSYKW